MDAAREDGGVVVVGRAEIDTRAPFRSVKEAVMLFGERVLAGEIYASKLEKMRAGATEKGQVQSKFGAMAAELEETKKSLQKAQEEGNFMANCIKSLKKELEQSKKELQILKSREYQKHPLVDHETEDLKFIENAPTVETTNAATTVEKTNAPTEEAKEIQRKRYVKFASPPSLAQVIVSTDYENEVLERDHSGKKTKKKQLIPLIRWFFSKK